MRLSFWVKVGLAATLVGLADWALFQASDVGLNMGLVLLALAFAAGVGRPAVRRTRLGLAALLAAVAMAVVQIEHVSFLAWLLFWVSLGVAMLAPRARADGVFPWVQRIAGLGVKSPFRMLLDAPRLIAARERRGRWRPQFVILVLPLVGGAVFLWLFAEANPVIGGWFAALRLPEPDFARIGFGMFIAVATWATLRARSLRRVLQTPDIRGELKLPGVTTASITLSLLVFNGLFALQNGLDIAFLWSGAPLPEGMTLAEYAHRGAYPLIATALLAGLFVVGFLRPGTATAEAPWVRRLVILWIVQNVFLVASTALRTFDYIDAYSLTRLRIAALLWMGLVATGLALVGWRLIWSRSTAWLINANAAAVAVVLVFCAVVDLGSMAAWWNVRHAREVGGRGAALDVYYLSTLNDASLVSLAELERRELPDKLRAGVASARADEMQRLAEQQADWRTATWRGARRLDAARELTAGANPR